jgi:hypothetical protein
MSDESPEYGAYLERIRAKGRILLYGATEAELRVVKAALNLYHTRNAEKNVTHPNMGWDEAARVAEELELRIG